MSAPGERAVATHLSHFQWSAILGGAAAVAGTSLTLNAFGAGIGLSVVSSAPTWRDSSAVYWFIGGVFLLFVSVISFAIGGYISGRMRTPLNADTVETEFRDGMQGLVTWGVAVALAALLALGATAQSAAGESIIATELDDLFRSGKVIDDIAYRRAEAARILLKSSGHNGVPNTDRTYLTTITSIVAGVPEVEAKSRVDDAIAASSQALHRARVAAVMQAFFVAAALFVGAVIAWYAATEGGKDRELGAYHFWDWSGRRRV
ncbi:MAG TPA: hypothetical protein VNX61_05485 [Rhizomicrobium sp.]|nr:hypothetical protein [Rhizomicrobium sp.]